MKRLEPKSNIENGSEKKIGPDIDAIQKKLRAKTGRVPNNNFMSFIGKPEKSDAEIAANIKKTLYEIKHTKGMHADMDGFVTWYREHPEYWEGNYNDLYGLDEVDGKKNE